MAGVFGARSAFNIVVYGSSVNLAALETARLAAQDSVVRAILRREFFYAGLRVPLAATMGLPAFAQVGESKHSAARSVINMDLSIFLTAEAWISLVTLLFLEIVLGVDNIVFISITTNRLSPEKQHIGRKLGLAGALVSRVIFLCFASYLVHMVTPLFTVDLGPYVHGFSIRDLVLFFGGAYLIYKGIVELRDVLALTEVKAESDRKVENARRIGLPQAVGTIMVMDVVFSIDSVITAVGLANHLIIMILAVMIAILLMMVFIDFIADFINKHAEMKILALCFITVIGGLLVLDGLGITTGIEMLDMHAEKLMVYFAMVFAFVLELIQMKYNSSLEKWREGRRVAEDPVRETPEGAAKAKDQLVASSEVGFGEASSSVK